MKILDGFAGALSGFAVVFYLLTFAVALPSLGLWFYRGEFEKNGTYEQMRMEKDQLDKVAQDTINYLSGRDSYLGDSAAVVNGTERLFFNEREIAHMVDVEVLFAWGLLIKRGAGIFLALSLAYFLIPLPGERKRRFALLLGWLRGFAAGTLVLFGALGVAIASNFSRAFTMFHKIFFTNDLWILDRRTDLLINMLPNQFFMDIAAFIGIAFVAGMVLVIVAASVIRRALKR